MRKLNIKGIIIACILVIGFIFIIGTLLYTLPEKNKEKGSIEEVSINDKEYFSRNDGKVNENLYKSLTENIYYGKVNYRPLYFAFRPLEDKESAIYSRYECSVYDYENEDLEQAHKTRTRYEVVINEDEITLNYIIGEEESTYSCEYKDGNLTVNGTTLEKINPKELSCTMYKY